MKKFLSLLLCMLLVVSMCACKGNSSSGGSMNSKNPRVEISVADFGKMQFELDPSNAPITVENFLKLVNEGFYDGLTFHRIIAGFMIQGGDPLGNGTGGSKETIKGEFAANGVDNKIEHRKGVISMARSQSFDSASSQFFICHDDATFLDEQYAAFGHMINEKEGFAVLDKIAVETRVLDDNGTVNRLEQPVIEYIKVMQ